MKARRRSCALQVNAHVGQARERAAALDERARAAAAQRALLWSTAIECTDTRAHAGGDDALTASAVALRALARAAATPSAVGRALVGQLDDVLANAAALRDACDAREEVRRPRCRALRRLSG